MKVLVIPDVHLKPWIFDNAEKIIKECHPDNIVCLGDIVDDFDKQNKLLLYKDTLNRLHKFFEDHPKALCCYGNHDISYLGADMFETGYSGLAEPIVRELYTKFVRMMDTRLLYVHRIDKVLFSHAGLVISFVDNICLEKGWNILYRPSLMTEEQLNKFDETTDIVLSRINSLRYKELWVDNSPIWVRPQSGLDEAFFGDYLQVVGHTPMSKIFERDGFLSVDVYSTYADGSKFGEEHMVIVDAETKKWEIIS